MDDQRHGNVSSRRSRATPAIPSDATSGGHELSVDEVIARYHGEWILLLVTRFDERFNPVQGVVVAHSPDRQQVSAALRREPPRAALPASKPSGHYYTFKAFPRVHVGETDEQAEARFNARRAAAINRARG